jgi:hypothetical protein
MEGFHTGEGGQVLPTGTSGDGDQHQPTSPQPPAGPRPTTMAVDVAVPDFSAGTTFSEMLAADPPIAPMAPESASVPVPHPQAAAEVSPPHPQSQLSPPQVADMGHPEGAAASSTPQGGTHSPQGMGGGSTTTGGSAPSVQPANERQEAFAQAKLENSCLVAYVTAMKFYVNRSEKPVLDNYWYTSEDGGSSNSNPGRHNNRRSIGGLTPSNAAHLRREGIEPVQYPLPTGLNHGLAGLSEETARLLSPWAQLPMFLQGIRPFPRYHRYLSSRDRELQHILYHTHLGRSGSAPLAFNGLGMLSNGLRSQGSIFGKGGHNVGGNDSPSVGHVWITMPILKSMSKETRALVETSHKRKGPLFAAMEALRESMLTTKASTKATVEVTLIDYKRLQKLEVLAAGKLYLQDPSRRSADEERTGGIDFEPDTFVLISVKSGSHVQKRVAQEAAAFAVFRLAIEIMFEGMAAGALTKPLAVRHNATPLHISTAEDLLFVQKEIYIGAIDNSERNYESAEKMWRSSAGKKKVHAAADIHRKSLRATAATLVAQTTGLKRERDEADAIFNQNKTSNTVTVGQQHAYPPPSTHDPRYAPHLPSPYTGGHSGGPYDPYRDPTQSPYPQHPQHATHHRPLEPYNPQPSHLGGGEPVGWGEDDRHRSHPYDQRPPPVQHHYEPDPRSHRQYVPEPLPSQGRRVEPPVSTYPSMLGGASQATVVQYNPSMSQAPRASTTRSPHTEQPSSIELGNNCDFTLPENGFVSPRHRLDAFGQIAGLNGGQRNALLVNMNARLKAAISLWPKSAEELRSVDTFRLLCSLIDALGGYGKVVFETIVDGKPHEEEELFLPSFSSATAPPPAVASTYRATICIILIAPAHVHAYNTQQHALLLEMLRAGRMIDKTRVQEPMSELTSNSGSKPLRTREEATKLASVAMIDALSPVIAAMHSYFKRCGGALAC